MYKNDKDEAQKMLGILRAKFRMETRAHVRDAIRKQADGILEVFPDLGKTKNEIVANEIRTVFAAVVQAVPTVEELLANRDTIAIVAHKSPDGIALAWSHANSGVIARDVIVSDAVDSPHKAVVLFTKSLLAENLAREVVTDLDSFVKVVNSTTKTKTMPQEISLLRYAISTGKLIVRRPQPGKGDVFFAKLHKECKRQQ